MQITVIGNYKDARKAKRRRIAPFVRILTGTIGTAYLLIGLANAVGGSVAAAFLCGSIAAACFAVKRSYRS